MKKLLLIIIVLLVTASVSAQFRQKGSGVTLDASLLNVAEMTITSNFILNPNFSLGIGTGVSYFAQRIEYFMNSQGEDDSFRYGGHFVPIYIEAKWYMLQTKITPYLQLRVGSDYSINNPAFGYYLSPSVGVHFGRFLVGASYNFQQFWPSGKDFNYYLGAWHFRLGWQF